MRPPTGRKARETVAPALEINTATSRVGFKIFTENIIIFTRYPANV